MLDEPVLVRHRLTREDVAALARLVRRSELRVLGAYLLVAVGVVTVLAVLDVGGGYLVVVASLAAAGLAAALLWVARERKRAVGRELALAFSPDGVGYAWDDQSGHLPWRGLEVRFA